MKEVQKEAKRRAEVMLAFAEGKEIENRCRGRDDWDEVIDPSWDWFSNDYRIKSPAKRKIMLDAWLDGDGELRYVMRQPRSVSEAGPRGWTRLPGLDLETEIDHE